MDETIGVASNMGMTIPPQRLLKWQRMLSPDNFNKTGGAKYHTAPSVVFPGAPDYPSDVPDDSVTIMFRITYDMMLTDCGHVVVRDPLVAEKQTKRGRKSAPIVVMSDTAVLCVIPVSANYYWSAHVLAEHRVVRMELRPDKATTSDPRKRDATKRGVTVIATFMPNHDEP